MIKDYVALDLETTGLNPNLDRILEIGAVKYLDGEAVEHFSTLVDCKMKIPALITDLTGIDDSMMEGAMETEEAVRKLVEFSSELPLLGHNVIFDYSFVKRQTVNLGQPFEKMGLDTLKIAKYCLPDLQSRSLAAMCSYYGIQQDHHHRALDDARSAASLYERLAEEFGPVFPRPFYPNELQFKVKRQSGITNSQKVYLNDLVKYHRIELDVCIESLTKNAASRLIDHIVSEKGRIKR